MKRFSKLFAFLFSFLMVITPVFAYTDVVEGDWFKGYVEDLRDRGIVDDAEFFRPQDPLKRAEWVKMVIEATGGLGAYTAPEVATFDDVPLGMWFSPYVEEAATRGIVMGFTDEEGLLTGFFGPEKAITRAEVAKVVVEGFDLEADQWIFPVFPDMTTEDWFYAYVNTARALSVVEGFENGTFKPLQNVTRAEAAKMLSVALKIAESRPTEMPDDLPNLPGETPESPTEEPVETPSDTPELPGESMETIPFEANDADINPGIALAGDTEKLVGVHHLQGVLEGFEVSRVTIVNDTTGDKFGDEPEESSSLKAITLKYPDKEGNLRTVTKTPESDGSTLFGDLDYFVRRDTPTPLEIYATLEATAMITEMESGENFRLGLQDIGNTDNTFKAIGEFSNEVTPLNDGVNVSYSNNDIQTVRRSRPYFTVDDQTSTLVTGSNKLISFEVMADPAGSIAFGRLVFEVGVSDSDGLGLDLSEFELFNGDGLVENVVIHDATGNQDLSPGGSSLSDGNSMVIVSFDEQQLVSPGQTESYYLQAKASGTQTNDTVATRFAEDNQALTGLSAVGQVNTGQIYVNGDATAGIFTGASDFSQAVGTDRHVLWSDLSYTVHQYPEVSGGVVSTGTGSADWINGYRVTNALPEHILAK